LDIKVAPGLVIGSASWSGFGAALDLDPGGLYVSESEAWLLFHSQAIMVFIDNLSRILLYRRDSVRSERGFCSLLVAKASLLIYERRVTP
jgi:hypothetical protein